MSQLLMKWETQPVTPVKIPDEYSEYVFKRGGDELFTEEEFKYQWIDLRDKNHSDEMVEWFHVVYDDAKVPDDGFFCILDKDNKIVATAQILLGEYTPDSATLHAVSASPEHRRKNLGKAVTVAVMKYAFDNGIKEVYLTTDDWRTAAVNLYVSLGFMPIMYTDGMRERWQKLCNENNFCDIKIIDEKGDISYMGKK